MPTPLDQLLSTVAPLRARLVEHEMYARLRTLDDLRTFMEHHVFAVWDFMSLLKALQLRLTGMALPWTPVGDPGVRRLVNEIVLAEESDELPGGGFASHFELYVDAMRRASADVSRLDDLLARLARGEALDAALEHARVPLPAAQFVRATWRCIESGTAAEIAAAFAFGREDLIPAMFSILVGDLRRRFPNQLETYDYYLERHVALDADEHTPMARRMVLTLCGDDSQTWAAATRAVEAALAARLALWDGVAAALSRAS